MFDIGWLELMVIGIVALIVVGPKDLPGMFRTVGQFVGKMRGMAREFQRSMEQAADESGIKEATDSFKDMDDKLGLNSIQTSAKSYAKNYVTQADQKAGVKDWSAESAKVASDAAKATAPAKPKAPAELAAAKPASEPKAAKPEVAKPKVAAKPKAAAKPTPKAKITAKSKASAKPKAAQKAAEPDGEA